MQILIPSYTVLRTDRVCYETLADIFLCYFEEKWVKTGDSRPSIWFRYMLVKSSPCLTEKILP